MFFFLLFVHSQRIFNFDFTDYHWLYSLPDRVSYEVFTMISLSSMISLLAAAVVRFVLNLIS